MPTDDKLLKDTTPLPTLDTVIDVGQVEAALTTPLPDVQYTTKTLPQGITLLKAPGGACLIQYRGITVKALNGMPTMWKETDLGVTFDTATHAIHLPWTLIREAEFWGRLTKG